MKMERRTILSGSSPMYLNGRKLHWSGRATDGDKYKTQPCEYGCLVKWSCESNSFNQLRFSSRAKDSQQIHLKFAACCYMG